MFSYAVDGCKLYLSSTMCNVIQDITLIQLRHLLILYCISLKILAWSVFTILRNNYRYCHILESMDCCHCISVLNQTFYLYSREYCKHAAKTFPFLIIYDGKGHETDEKPYSINTRQIFPPHWFWKVFLWLATLRDTQRKNSKLVCL